MNPVMSTLLNLMTNLLSLIMSKSHADDDVNEVEDPEHPQAAVAGFKRKKSQRQQFKLGLLSIVALVGVLSLMTALMTLHLLGQVQHQLARVPTVCPCSSSPAKVYEGENGLGDYIFGILPALMKMIQQPAEAGNPAESNFIQTSEL